MTSPRTLTYEAVVDWDNNGNYTGTYDDVIEHVLAEERIAVTGQGRDQARGTAPPQIPTMVYALRNTDRRYSSENTSSVLAGKLLLGRPCQLRVIGGTDWLLDSADVSLSSSVYFLGGTTDRAIFTGELDGLDEEPEPARQRVKLTARGRLGRLSRARVTTQIYTDVTTGEAMEYLLIAAGLSAAEYTIDDDVIDNGRILSYWYGDGRDVYKQALELWASEGYSAFFGEDQDGVIVFQGRNYRTLTERSQEIQATYTDETTEGGLRHIGFRIQPSLRDIINRPVVEIVLRAAASLGVVWEYDETITLDGSGAASIIAKPSTPFTGAVTPVVTTDFTLSAGVVSVALSRTSGTMTEIQFSGGTAGATVSALQLRAQAFEETATIEAETLVDTTDSVTAYGERTVRLDVWPGLAPTDAISLCDAMVLAYQEPRAVVQVDIANVDGLHAHEILNRDIGDRIHVNCFQAGADIDVTIETKIHRIHPQLHTVTFGCEKVVEFDWALYDIDLYGSGLFGQ